MQTIQKYIRTSPRKLRLIADAVRSLSPAEALRHLKFVEKRAADPLFATITQAVANARSNFGISIDKLKFKTIDIGEGPTFKRFRAVSRGSAHSIMKRSSHIKVVLEEKNGPKS